MNLNIPPVYVRKTLCDYKDDLTKVDSIYNNYKL